MQPRYGHWARITCHIHVTDTFWPVSSRFPSLFFAVHTVYHILLFHSSWFTPFSTPKEHLLLPWNNQLYIFILTYDGYALAREREKKRNLFLHDSVDCSTMSLIIGGKDCDFYERIYDILTSSKFYLMSTRRVPLSRTSGHIPMF